MAALRAGLAWLLYGIATLSLLFGAMAMSSALDPARHVDDRSTALGLSSWITFDLLLPIGVGCAVLAWLLRTRSPEAAGQRVAMDRAAMTRLTALGRTQRQWTAVALLCAGLAWLLWTFSQIGRSIAFAGQEHGADYVRGLAAQDVLISTPILFAAAALALLARRVMLGTGAQD